LEELAPWAAALACMLAVTALGTRTRAHPALEGSRPRGAAPTLRLLLGWVGGCRVLGWMRRSPRIIEARSLVPNLPSTEEIVGTKVALGAAGLIVGSISPIPPLALILGAAGYRAPDVRLAKLIAGRRRSAESELPVLLDLLAASASAGLTGQLAVRVAVGVTEGALAEEFDRALRAVDLGGRWRDEMSSVAERLALPDLRRAVATLGRSDVLGASLSDQLGGIAADVREARRAATTERARKAPVKMLFPLVFLILPAFLLLTVVPVLLATFRAIH
jgi:tight adherence protein C